MAKKKTGLTSTLFRGINPYAQEDEEVEEQDTLTTLPLAAIHPDSGQPRRLLPADLAEALLNGRMEPGEVMATWMARAEVESSPSFAALLRLANSIARHGLINPITVRLPREDESLPAGAEYLIVTGERRYWAHVLLARQERQIMAGDTVQTPDRVRASVAGPGISVRAHQLIENIMREDINAVEKARGLWALRYELSDVTVQVNDSSPGNPDDEVNDSSPALDETGVNDSSPPTTLVPWTEVAAALGIGNRYRIFLTSVLNLVPAAQQIVQEEGLAETTIRPIVQKLRDEPELQVAALRQLVAWQQENEEGEVPRRAVTRAVSDLVERLLEDKVAARTAGPAVRHAVAALDAEAQTRRFRRRVRGAARFLHRLPTEERVLLARDLALDHAYSNVVEEVQSLRDQLDALLQQIDDYRTNR